MHSASRLALFALLFGTVACVGGDDNVLVDGGKDVSTTGDTSIPDTSPMDTGPDTSGCMGTPGLSFYVNSATGNDANNGGNPSCPFKTISAALVASKDDAHVNAVINVAAGTYAVGETFPLVVDRGRSLIGAGAMTTTIQGSSSPFTTSGTGSFLDSGMHYVTMLVGDVMGGAKSLGATTISGLTVIPASTITMPTTNYFGIVCIAGNAPNTATTPPFPAPNLILKTMTIGPNFDTGAILGYSPTQQVACNAAITTSTITGSTTGIAAGGCGGSGNPVTSWPSVQVGDGMSADANTFTGNGIGIFGEGCGSINSFNLNHFVSGYRGIVLVTQAQQYFEILSNTFDGTASPQMGMGINTNNTAVIAKLDDNVFTNITATAAATTAIGAPSGFALAFGVAAVTEALRNNINNNDNGIYIGGVGSTFDFSSGGMTANANQIYCNSRTGGTPGYDLILAYNGGSALKFSGNAWDHNGPSTSVSITTSPNGTDIVTGTSGGATTTSSTITSTACTGSHIH